MGSLFIVFWFVMGIGAYHIGEGSNRAKGETESPAFVWVALGGPLALLLVVVLCIEDAMKSKGGNK